jgi:hypothetical protein
MIFKKVLHSYNTAFQCESRDIVRALYTANNTEDKREKTQALSLAKECYSMKLELLTNATVVDDAIRFVSEHSKSKQHEINYYQKEGEEERAEQSMTNKLF